ncbi:MAG TPA: hypothetical protein VKB05_20985 [Pyrinomonadaceae bacterium]|nr:hypothetical protein [Pyrinomonadaceae bacterium]
MRDRKTVAAASVGLLAGWVLVCSACAFQQSEATRARRATSGNARIIEVKDGRQLQRALNDAAAGDELVLDAGVTYNGNFKLPVKSGDAFITIRSSRCTELPNGVRVTPAQAPLMARLATPNVSPVLLAPPRSHHWRFQCLEFTQGSAVGESGYNLIQLGEGDAAAGQKTLDDVPHHLEFDRVIVRARDDKTAVQRGITLNSGYTSVTNSHISGIKWAGVETQAVGGWNGPGPFEIVNNYLEAAGVNVLFGGARPSIPDLVPSDITIKNNDVVKLLSWRQGDPSFAGTAWTVKNLLELKNARRVTISDNRMKNNWPHAQVGWAVIFNAFHDGGWEVVDDVQFLRNTIRNSTNGINLRGLDTGDKALRMHRIKIVDNHFEGLGAYGQEAKPFQLLGGSEDVEIDHNTVSNSTHSLIMDSAPGFSHVRLKFINNTVPHGSYGVFSDGGALGKDAMNLRASNWLMEKNALIATPPDLRSKYPKNYFPETPDAAARLLGTDNVAVGARIPAATDQKP